MRRATLAALFLLLAGCQSSSHAGGATTTTESTSVATTTAVTAPNAGAVTTVPIQASGPRTVLSAIGLNVRSRPSKTATIAGTAAQGAVLTVISHTDGGGGGGGWYQVKGATVTGYISDNPALSADGTFMAYSSSTNNFAALLPEHWTTTEVAPTAVVFRPPTGSDSVVLSTAAASSKLPRASSNYHTVTDTVVVVCGVTGDLVTFVDTGAAASTSVAAAVVAERYLAQVHLTLDAQHALGLQANLSDLAQLLTVEDIMYSLSFPYPQCEQGASLATSSTTPATTVP